MPSFGAFSWSWDWSHLVPAAALVVTLLVSLARALEAKRLRPKALGDADNEHGLVPDYGSDKERKPIAEQWAEAESWGVFWHGDFPIGRYDESMSPQQRADGCAAMIEDIAKSGAPGRVLDDAVAADMDNRVPLTPEYARQRPVAAETRLISVFLQVFLSRDLQHASGAKALLKATYLHVNECYQLYIVMDAFAGAGLDSRGYATYATQLQAIGLGASTFLQLVCLLITHCVKPGDSDSPALTESIAWPCMGAAAVLCQCGKAFFHFKRDHAFNRGQAAVFEKYDWLCSERSMIAICMSFRGVMFAITQTSAAFLSFNSSATGLQAALAFAKHGYSAAVGFFDVVAGLTSLEMYFQLFAHFRRGVLTAASWNHMLGFFDATGIGAAFSSGALWGLSKPRGQDVARDLAKGKSGAYLPFLYKATDFYIRLLAIVGFYQVSNYWAGMYWFLLSLFSNAALCLLHWDGTLLCFVPRTVFPGGPVASTQQGPERALLQDVPLCRGFSLMRHSRTSSAHQREAQTYDCAGASCWAMMIVIPLSFWQTFVAPTEVFGSIYPVLTTYYRTLLFVKWELETALAVAVCVVHLERPLWLQAAIAFAIHAIIARAWLQLVADGGARLVWLPEFPRDDVSGWCCNVWRGLWYDGFANELPTPHTVAQQQHAWEQAQMAQDAANRQHDDQQTAARQLHQGSGAASRLPPA